MKRSARERLTTSSTSHDSSLASIESHIDEICTEAEADAKKSEVEEEKEEEEVQFPLERTPDLIRVGRKFERVLRFAAGRCRYRFITLDKRFTWEDRQSFTKACERRNRKFR